MSEPITSAEVCRPFDSSAALRPDGTAACRSCGASGRLLSDGASECSRCQGMALFNGRDADGIPLEMTSRGLKRVAAGGS